MSLHFYLAPAATGKTAYALAHAREAARGLRGWVRVCVANQLQRRAWKERLAEAGGAMGVRVLTFAQLFRECLRETRATEEAITALDEPQQHRLLRATLDTLPLAHYRSLRDKPGFAVLLHGLIAELKAARISPETFTDAVIAVGDEPRLRELALIYVAYQNHLQANDWADEEELGWLALQALENAPQLATDWSLLVADGFDNLTTVQRDVLHILSHRAQETIITLTGAPNGPERGLVHRRFDATRQALERALEIKAEPLPDRAQWGSSESDMSDECCARQAAPLTHLERSLFVSQATTFSFPSQADGAESVTRLPSGLTRLASGVALIAAADRAGEVRAALRWLKARLVLDGCRPGEVALLARSVEPYRLFIQQTASEFGIPVHLLDGLPLAANPAIATLLHLLHLFLPLSAQDPQPALPRRLVVEAWRSPYLDWGEAGIQEGDADRLDSLARWGQVIGGTAQWHEAFTRLIERTAEEHADDEESPVNLASAEEARTLLGRFERFLLQVQPPDGGASMGDYVAWLEGLIGPEEGEEAEDRGSLHVVICARQGDDQAAERDVAALRALKDVLRGLVWAELALGTPAPADYGAFYAEAQVAIESATYRLPEEPGAEEVLVADVVQARGVLFRAVAVLGLAEGEFPTSLQEDPLLRDADRRHLSRLGVDLPLSTESAEAGYFYETITRARAQLLITRPRLAENGAIWEPSPYWQEVCRLTGVQPVVLGSDSRIPLDRTASWPEFLEGLAECPSDSPWHAWASREEAAGYRAWQMASAVFRERFRRQPSGQHNGDLSAHGAVLAEHYGPQHTWSASRLESYRTCPHFFFVGTVLGLKPRQEPAEGLDARQLGNIYHRLFQKVYESCPESARDEPERLLATLQEVGGTILDQAPRREGFRATAWWFQTREEILGNVRRSLQNLAAIAEGYLPTAFERSFDHAQIWASDDGQDSLYLRGFVDRLDRHPDGSWRIIDYKTAGPTDYGPKALEQGKKLQLPLYALAMQQMLGGEVRDGFYWHVRDAKASALRLRSYGVAQSMQDALQFVQEAVQGARRGAFEPHPPADGCPGYCPAGGFCWQYRQKFGG